MQVVTVTLCKDKAGADQSVAKARDWIAANAKHISVAVPKISEGAVILRLG